MIKRIIETALMVGAMFVGIVIVFKILADTFARFVLWTAHLWGMEYK